MAIDATSVVPSRRGANLRLVAASEGIRDDAERVIVPTTDALAPWMELVAIADEAIAAANRIVMAAAAGSRSLVINEAGRLAHRAQACREEARARIVAIENPERAA